MAPPSQTASRIRDAVDSSHRDRVIHRRARTTSSSQGSLASFNEASDPNIWREAKITTAAVCQEAPGLLRHFMSETIFLGLPSVFRNMSLMAETFSGRGSGSWTREMSFPEDGIVEYAMFCARYPTMSLATRSVAFLRSTHLLPFLKMKCKITTLPYHQRAVW